jgi:hypothetical protein
MNTKTEIRRQKKMKRSQGMSIEYSRENGEQEDVRERVPKSQ